MNDASTPIDAQLLARFVPMSALDARHRDELAHHAELVTLAPGDTLRDDLARADSSYYLLEGSLCLSGGGLADEVVKASDPESRFALPSTDVVGRHAHSIDGAKLLKIDRAKISTLLIWAEASRPAVDPSDGKRLHTDITTVLLQSRLFERVPPSNIERLGELMEPLPLSAGETIVRQGEPGEHYFIVARGRCEVLRESDDGDGSIRLAVLGEGESFGEEALLTDSRRNASVRMLEDGLVLRLTREYFVDLVSEPLVREVSHERAEDLIGTGAHWVDVRLREEFERDGLDGAINVPLSEIRAQLNTLKPGESYVVYCSDGRRSNAAAFLLSQRGIHASWLRGGIGSRRPELRGEAARARESLSQLQTELAQANAELDRALQHKADADAARDVEGRLLEQTEKGSAAKERLERLTAQAQAAEEALRAAMTRKRELEARVRDAEADAASRWRAAEAECERMRERAQARLEEEKKKLARRYEEASQRLQHIDQARREAEARFEAERERIERELEQARAEMEAEAAKIRESMDIARRDAEGKADAIRRDHMTEEDRLRRETEEALRAERSRLEQEFAESIAAQEKAKHLLDETEAERRKAERETTRLLRELHAELAAQREAEEQRRAAEIGRLREAADAAKARLEAAERSQAAAQRRHQKFSASLVELGTGADAKRKAELEGELDDVKRELDTAERALSRAQAEHASADYAHTVAEETAAAAHSRANELRLQLYEEMEGWISEEKVRSEEELERTAHYARQLERIQAEKDARRRDAERATSDMFSEIERLLSGEEDETTDSAMRARLMAEEKMRLVQDAHRQVSEQTEQARAAASHPPGEQNPKP